MGNYINSEKATCEQKIAYFKKRLDEIKVEMADEVKLSEAL